MKKLFYFLSLLLLMISNPCIGQNQNARGKNKQWEQEKSRNPNPQWGDKEKPKDMIADQKRNRNH